MGTGNRRTQAGHAILAGATSGAWVIVPFNLFKIRGPLFSATCHESQALAFKFLSVKAAANRFTSVLHSHNTCAGLTWVIGELSRLLKVREDEQRST